MSRILVMKNNGLFRSQTMSKKEQSTSAQIEAKIFLVDLPVPQVTREEQRNPTIPTQVRPARHEYPKRKILKRQKPTTRDWEFNCIKRINSLLNLGAG